MMVSIMRSIISPIMRAMFPGGGELPANAIVDRLGQPVVDRAVQQIVSRS